LTLIFLLFMCTSAADEPVPVPSAEIGAAAKELSSSLRQVISGDEGGSIGTFILHDHWNDPNARLNSVILVPGLLAGRDSLSRIRQELSERGIATATYRYANQLAVPPVASKLAELLKELQQEQPDRSIYLIAHSLGGIVARAAIESESERPRNVKRLIMISPPNHGTALAAIDSSEFTQLVAPLRGDRVDLGFVDDAIDGFVGEARESLQPGSALLKSMNSRPRAVGVRYTILAGTGGPIEKEWLELPLMITDLLLGELTENDRAEQPNPLAPLKSLIETDEWLSGRGDGVVSTQSARLDGVDDMITLPFAHNDFGAERLEPKRRNAVDQAMDQIVRRLRPHSN
jgi:pimeloyl-ACP methyl ester carboxylesterase